MFSIAATANIIVIGKKKVIAISNNERINDNTYIVFKSHSIASKRLFSEIPKNPFGLSSNQVISHLTIKCASAGELVVYNIIGNQVISFPVVAGYNRISFIITTGVYILKKDAFTERLVLS